jgi:hypothetical protein
VEAYQEFQELSSLVEATPIVNGALDTRRFVWGDKYTPSKLLQFLVCSSSTGRGTQGHMGFSGSAQIESLSLDSND